MTLDAYLRKYFWVLNLAVIAVASYFLASGVSQIIAAKLPRPQRQGAAAQVELAAPQMGLGGGRGPLAIAERNIFCSTCKPPGAEEATAGAGGPPSDTPVKTSLEIRLLATMVSDQDSAWSFAAITDVPTQRTAIFRIGNKLPGGAEVADILERRVLLLNEGRTEFLDLQPEQGAGQGGGPAAAAPVAAPPAARPPGGVDLSGGVRKLGPKKWEIRRSALNKVLGNTTLLARSARIVPSVKGGKANGFKLYAIRPGSIYSLIGLQNGDTIHSVNGRSITTPDRALEVYTRVRSASHLTITFTRRGKTVTHDYTIR